MTMNMKIQKICQDILGKVTPQVVPEDLKYTVSDLQMTFGCIANSLVYTSVFLLQTYTSMIARGLGTRKDLQYTTVVSIFFL